MFFQVGCLTTLALCAHQMARLVFACTVAVAVLAALLCCEATQIIDSDVKWDVSMSPISLNDSVVVTQKGKLTIAPGVIVELAQDIDITVNGVLVADGTKDKLITFHKAPNAVRLCALFWFPVLIFRGVARPPGVKSPSVRPFPFPTGK